jgi:hypothetical protein
MLFVLILFLGKNQASANAFKWRIGAKGWGQVGSTARMQQFVRQPPTEKGPVSRLREQGLFLCGLAR